MFYPFFDFYFKKIYTGKELDFYFKKIYTGKEDINVYH